VPSLDDLTAHHWEVRGRAAEDNQAELEKRSGDLSEVRGQPPVDYPLLPVGGPRLKAESQHLDEHRDGQTQCREHWPNDHRIDGGLGPKGSHLSSAER